MIWVCRFVLVILYLIVYDLFLGFIGFLLVKLKPLKHPRLYIFGLRCLAMSTLWGAKKLPSYCIFDCSSTECRNWTCPNYSKPEK